MEKSKYQAHAEVLIKLSNQSDLAGKGIDKVFATITETVAQTLDVDQVSIWQFTPAGKIVRCLSVFSRFKIEKSAGSIDLSAHTAYIAALHTEYAIASSEIALDTRVAAIPADFWMDGKLKSYVHIPVRITNQLVGILRMESRTEHTWPQDDIQFCAHVASLISQTFLTNELKIRDERNIMLRSISTELTYRFEIPTLLSELVRKSVEMVNGSHGALFLTDPERRVVVSTAGYNIPAKQGNQTYRYGEHVAGKVAETGQELLIKDYRVWPGRTDEVKKDEPATTILSVPLRSRGEVRGVLQVTRRDGDQPFMDFDRETLTSLANLACLAIEHGDLLETNQRLNKFQDSMKQILETTTFASSVMDFLETTIDYITHALSTGLAVIHIEDVSTFRGLAAEADRQIESVLIKRGKRFNPTIVVHDVASGDAGFPDLAEMMLKLNVQAYILAPILMNHERVGYLCIASYSSRTWEADEIKMMEIATNQVGLAVEGIRFYHETQSQMDITRRMMNVTTSLNRLVSMDDLIPMIGEGAVRLLGADSLAVVLREQNEIVRSSWVFGLPKLQFSQVVNGDGKEWLKIFSSDIEPVLVTNISKSSLPQPVRHFMTSAGIKSAKLAPITHSGNVIGMIAGFFETVQDWSPRDRQMIVTFTNTVALALQNTWSYEQLENGYMDLAVSLADTMDARESNQKAASLKVADWAQRTAQSIGLPREEQEVIRMAALLHDIGKVDVPEDVIKKPGPLTREEKQKLQNYPLKSEKLISPLSDEYHEIGLILRGLRERYDGSGYPDKRKGQEIPLASRILSVADAYASMLESRPYRSARSHEAAVEEIIKNSGKQFDPQVVDAFMKAVDNHPELVH